MLRAISAAARSVIGVTRKQTSLRISTWIPPRPKPIRGPKDEIVELFFAALEKQRESFRQKLKNVPTTFGKQWRFTRFRPA